MGIGKGKKWGAGDVKHLIDNFVFLQGNKIMGTIFKKFRGIIGLGVVIAIISSGCQIYPTDIEDGKPTEKSIELDNADAEEELNTLETGTAVVDDNNLNSSQEIISTPPQPDISPIENLSIPVNSETGMDWTAPSNGTFYFEFISGAYSLWPHESFCRNLGCWRMRVHAYEGCEVSWQEGNESDKLVPRNESFKIGNEGEWLQFSSYDEAEEFGKQLNPIPRDLNAGDCIKFVVIDTYNPTNGYSTYGDNQGQPILIQISQ